MKNKRYGFSAAHMFFLWARAELKHIKPRAELKRTKGQPELVGSNTPKADACRQQTVLLGGSLPQNPSVLATSIYMDQFLLKSGIENGGHREEMETDGTDVTSTGFFSRPL